MHASLPHLRAYRLGPPRRNARRHRAGRRAPTAAAQPARTPAAAALPEFVDIEGAGGITLKANVLLPADASTGSTRQYPLIVLPTSWATPQIEYFAQARKLADSGYVVVTYNSRGFWQSGGRIETGGPKDIADASHVIDWALAHTPADEDRVGMGGVSYGAGISLLAAGHDPRIKAVTALSGWADLIGAIYSGRTQHLQAAGLLGASGGLTGRPSAELREILADFLSSDLDKEDEMIAWGKKRSPATYLDRINDNGAAIMLGNAWNDSIFPPNQYADFYEKLRGPKRLEFRPGDHATAEATGLLGLPNDTWSHARRWFDRYLKGERNGIATEAPVQLKSRSGGGYEGFGSWREVSTGSRTVPRSTGRESRPPERTPAPTAARYCSPGSSTSSSSCRPWCTYRCCRAPGPPYGSRSATRGKPRCAAPRPCTRP